MPHLNVLKSLALALALAGCSSGSVLDSISASGETATSLNAFRAANGRKALASDGRLTALAGAHATDMADRKSTRLNSSHRT